MFTKTRHIVVGIIDFFHRPFARYIPTQTFRYLACGGSNTVFNWCLYSFTFNIIMHRHDLILAGGMMKITAPVVAYMVSFGITTPLGFILSRHIVFPESNLHGHVQFFRYAVVTISLILVAYVLVKVFAVIMPIVRADIRYIFVMAISAVLSYLSQRFYSFKIVEQEQEVFAE